jgi:hypothetical protein
LFYLHARPSIAPNVPGNACCAALRVACLP